MKIFYEMHGLMKRPSVHVCMSFIKQISYEIYYWRLRCSKVYEMNGLTDLANCPHASLMETFYEIHTLKGLARCMKCMS